MSESSKICQIMKEYGDQWRDYFKETYPCIMIKDVKDIYPDCPYLIFNYFIGADFSDPIVQEARGIIINEETREVVCFPFRKFGKYYESYADTINWSKARVQEKLDGSIIKLWFDRYMNAWTFSSNSCIYAIQAQLPLPNGDLGNLMSIIQKCSNFHDLLSELESLDKDKTYIFELTSPYNRAVIEYQNALLYHIGTRNNITGLESEDDIGIIKPRMFQMNGPKGIGLDECIAYLETINNSDGNIVSNCEHEGFVVVDDKWNRVKVKSPIYTMLHNIISNSSSSIELLMKYLLEKKINVTDICEHFPEKAHFIKYYDYKLSEFLNRSEAFLNIARQIYKESNYNKKTVANVIKYHQYSKIAFQGLGNAMSVLEILNLSGRSTIKRILDYIPKYEPENFGYLFAMVNEEMTK